MQSTFNGGCKGEIFQNMQQYWEYWTINWNCGRRFDQDLVQSDGSLQTLTLTSYFDGGEQCNALNIPTNISTIELYLV